MLRPLEHIPRAMAGQVAGVSVALVDDAGAVTVVLASQAELLTADECDAVAELLTQAGGLLRARLRKCLQKDAEV